VSNLRLIPFFFLFASQLCGAVDINVVGLYSGMAVVAIDGGKPRTLKVGDVTPENVKLIKANSEEAVFEVAGKRETLTMGRGISVPGASGKQRATLTADAMGHFFVTAEINGISMRFLVDTGASLVTLSADNAKEAGINYLAGSKVLIETANGLIHAYRVKLDSVRLGGITLHNVDGVVAAGKFTGDTGLLGLSFLNRTEMQRNGDTMTLTRRY